MWIYWLILWLISWPSISMKTAEEEAFEKWRPKLRKINSTQDTQIPFDPALEDFRVKEIRIKPSCHIDAVKGPYEEPFGIDFYLPTICPTCWHQLGTRLKRKKEQNCHGFFLCYESQLDSRNGRVKPQFMDNNVTRACQQYGNPNNGTSSPSNSPVWHGIGLKICIELLKSAHGDEWHFKFSLHSSFTERVYGVVESHWRHLDLKLSPKPILSLVFETFMLNEVDHPIQMPMTITQFCLDSLCSDRKGSKMRSPNFAPDVDMMNVTTLYNLKDGASVFAANPGIWLLPLDVAINGDGLFHFRLVHSSHFSVAISSRQKPGIHYAREDTEIVICHPDEDQFFNQCQWPNELVRLRKK